MFSGIIEEVGVVLAAEDTALGRQLKINASIVTEDVALGDSISVSGTCLTVTAYETGQWFVVEAIAETLRRTTLGQLQAGTKVNLERALKFSDRLGGHLVSGHVDAVATVSSIKEEGSSRMITFDVIPLLSPFFVEKGSVAVAGVSLTVVDFEPKQLDSQAQSFSFRVALIPHTLDVTTLGELKEKDSVNVETDIVARYVARWVAPNLSQNLNKVHASLPFAVEQS